MSSLFFLCLLLPIVAAQFIGLADQLSGQPNKLGGHNE